MERPRASRYLITPCVLILSFAPSLLAQDDIILTLDTGPGADEVSLQWTGGQSPWQVFRSVDPSSVTAPGNSLGDTDHPSAAARAFHLHAVFLLRDRYREAGDLIR